MQLQKIAAGALDTTLDVEQFHGQERGIAASVNNIRAGLSEAIQERIRNERMKADLITNVSHDIKTPLTSIVNYVDLLKRENLENENARNYIRVLDEKSQAAETADGGSGRSIKDQFRKYPAGYADH